MDRHWAKLRELNVARCNAVFHPLDSWSVEMWATACFCEVGETVNQIKKLIRGDGSVHMVAPEIADTVIYTDLMLARARVDMAGLGFLSIDALADVGAAIDPLDAARMFMACGEPLHEVAWMHGEPRSAINAATAVLRASAAAGKHLKFNVLDAIAAKFDADSMRRGWAGPTLTHAWYALARHQDGAEKAALPVVAPASPAEQLAQEKPKGRRRAAAAGGARK